MDKYLVIYHKEDNDGVFSGALFYNYLTTVLNIKDNNIHMMGADYNDLAEFAKKCSMEYLKETYKSIIMTDVSFNDWKYMKTLWKEFGHNFIWCDHHAPIIHLSLENHFDDAPGVRDTNRSAILNVWKYLYDQFDEAYNAKKVPELLRILSAYDSWSYEREGYDFDYVRNINKGVTNHFNLNIKEVMDLIDDIKNVYLTDKPHGKLSAIYKDKDIIEEFYQLGKKLNEYDDQCNENLVNTSGDCSWMIEIHDEDKGRPLYKNACALFVQGPTNSTMFKSLKKTHREVSQGIVFKHLPNSNWVISLYNINDDDWFHCGDFLKEKYKGGGHKGAAGCTITQEQFIKILKNKII